MIEKLSALAFSENEENVKLSDTLQKSLNVSVFKWFKIGDREGFGFGFGYGFGYGNSYGNRYGDGYGNGFGDGYGDGNGL